MISQGNSELIRTGIIFRSRWRYSKFLGSGGGRKGMVDYSERMDTRCR